MMQEVLGRLVGSVCLVYIDDVVVWGNTPEEAISNTEKVMDALAAHGLVLNGAKCCFLARSISLLGHLVSEGRLMPQVHKLDALKNPASIPKTIR